MASSEGSDNKILLFNNNEPPELNLYFFEKIYSQNNISYKDVISKVKCLKKYDEVLMYKRTNTKYLTTDTFFACFHWSTAFTFAPGFVIYSTIHIICGCITAVGKIPHRIPAVTNLNLWFCWFKRVW